MNAKFTSKVESYIATAAELAQENSHQQLTPIHLAIAIFEDNEGVGKQAAVKCAGEETYKSLLRTLRKRLVRLPAIDPPPDQCYPSKDFTSVVKKAQTEQKRRQDAYLGVDVLLLSLINDSEVSAAIAEAGVTKHAIENALKEVRPQVGMQGTAGVARSGSSVPFWLVLLQYIVTSSSSVMHHPVLVDKLETRACTGCMTDCTVSSHCL